MKKLVILLTIVLAVSLGTNIYLSIPRPINGYIEKAAIISCFEDWHRPGKYMCDGYTYENKDFKFSFQIEGGYDPGDPMFSIPDPLRRDI